MDTSKVYIKMCDCEEVQIYRKPKVKPMTDGRVSSEWDLENGDFIWIGENHEDIEVIVKGDTVYSPYGYNQPGNTTIEIGMVGYDEGAGFTVERIIWLPRQDQIQEMLHNDEQWLEKDNSPFKFPIRVGDSKWNYILQQFIRYNDMVGLELPDRLGDTVFSFEQLWLAFYMHEKHGKTWDGEKWV